MKFKYKIINIPVKQISIMEMNNDQWDYINNYRYAVIVKYYDSVIIVSNSLEDIRGQYNRLSSGRKASCDIYEIIENINEED